MKTCNAIDYCERLGRRVADAFAARNHCTAELPAVAYAALADDPPAEHVDLAEIFDYLATTSRLPAQGDPETGFGEPSLTLYADECFRIDLLVWRRATTSIHQHGFSGAFTVLRGSSIQTTYEFEPHRVLSDALALGDISLKSIEGLQPGHIELIPAGESLIHSVFHLDVPSVTFLIRSHNHLAYAPQLTYDRPYIARDPVAHNEIAMKRVHTFRYLLDVEPQGLERWLDRVLEHSNDVDLYPILGEVFRTRNRTRTLWLHAVEKARERSEVVDRFVAVLLEQERARRLWGMRKTFSDRAHRVCIAALLSACNWRHVQEIIGANDTQPPSTARTAGLVADICAAADPAMSVESTVGVIGRMLDGLMQNQRADETSHESEAAAIGHLSSCELLRPLWSPRAVAAYVASR